MTADTLTAASENFPAQLRGLRLILGRNNKPVSGRTFAQQARIRPGTLRAIESGRRPLNDDDRLQIAHWIGAEWSRGLKRWVYTFDHKLPFSRELFELYSTHQFNHPHARDVEAHMALLALLNLLQELPGESYRSILFKIHAFLAELAEQFAPGASEAIRNLRPHLAAYRDVKTKKLEFSGIDHPNCQKVPGSEVLGPKLEDLILNFHRLRMAQTGGKQPL
jgi:hypothetical protein